MGRSAEAAEAGMRGGLVIPQQPRLHVVVTAKHPLVRDAVCSALESRSVISESIAIPAVPSQFHELRRRLAVRRPSVGLLLTEIDDAPDLRRAVCVITEIDLPWVLVTATPPGPAWGAVIEAGARDIMRSDHGVEDLVVALRQGGTSPMLSTQTRKRVLDAWSTADGRFRELTRRVKSLSAREMEILAELNQGWGVPAIASHSGVTEGTVRAQVKSILRKLCVSSQLEAVASYRAVNEAIRG